MLQGKMVRREDNVKVIWKEAKKRPFSVKSFYAALEVGRMLLFVTNFIWNLWVPSKVSFFTWEAS